MPPPTNTIHPVMANDFVVTIWIIRYSPSGFHSSTKRLILNIALQDAWPHTHNHTHMHAHTLHDHWSLDECPDDQMSLNNGRGFCRRRRFGKPSSGLARSHCLRIWHSCLFRSQPAWPSWHTSSFACQMLALTGALHVFLSSLEISPSL